MNNTIPTLDDAIRRLNDTELRALVARTHRVAERFALSGDDRVTDVFAALMLLGADEQDRRRDLVEHARCEIEGGGEAGELLG